MTGAFYPVQYFFILVRPDFNNNHIIYINMYVPDPFSKAPII